MNIRVAHFVLFHFIFSVSMAQPMHVDTHQKGKRGGRQTAVVSGMNTLVTEYFSVKDALISGKEKTAAQKAQGFAASLERITPEALTAMELASLNRVQDSLLSGARAISNSIDIEEQRRSFASFSQMMWMLVKGAGTNVVPIYQQYCPRKNAYWLSGEQAIRNPYLGKKMLRCGKVSATL